MKITNIQWETDMSDIYDLFDDLSPQKASTLLRISIDFYKKMSIAQKYDLIDSKIHHCPAFVDTVLGLPEEIECPKEITDEEDISNWLSNKYGYCHNGFSLDTDKER